MAGWSFRKRVKIAPGVSLNFSKNGVSTTVGPKGARMTFGSNGTYLNTSIPGTGLYRRQKIDGGKGIEQSPNGKNGVGCMATTIVSIFIAASICIFCDVDSIWSTSLIIAGILLTIISIIYFSKNGNNKNENNIECMVSSKPKKQKGFLKTIVWILLIVSSLMFMGGLLTIFDSNVDVDEVQKNETVVETEDNEDAKNDNKTRDILLTILYGTISFVCIIALVKIEKSPKKVPLNNSRNDECERLKIQADKETNPLKKKVLNDHIGFLMQRNAEIQLLPLIQKYKSKVSKKNKPKDLQLLQQYENDLKKVQDEASLLRYNLMDELSDVEKEKYAEFCDLFKLMRECKKAWYVTSENHVTEQKSWANVSIKRSPCSLVYGCFKELNTPFAIPRISLPSASVCIFYPRFVIVTKQNDFDVLPISAIKMKHSITRFQEEETVPSDAERLGTTYQYVNKDGGPDKRYSYNPSIPIVRYGEIEIEPFNTKLMFSNHSVVGSFCESFEALKSVCVKNDNSGFQVKSLADYGYDSLFEDAAHLIVINQQGSTSLIQRKFSIGYNRAGGIMDQLESAGIVGPFESGKARNVLISDEQTLNQLLDSLRKNPTNVIIQEANNEVTEKLYNDYLVVIERITSIINWAKSNQSLCDSLADVHISFRDNNEIRDKDQLIKLLIVLDFLKCFLKLGKQLDFKTSESFGLLMLFAAAYNQLIIKFEHIATYQVELNKTMLDFYLPLQKSIENNPEPNGGFLFSQVLGEIDKKMQLKYLIALHRFSTIVAGIDNNISEDEQAGIDYISEKMSSPEFDDVSNTNIESHQAGKETISKSKPTKNRSNTAAKELESLIGLTSVKAEVTSLANYIKIQKMRQEKGLKTPPVSFHCVFTGNPGTGKTTVARIVAQIYQELGILKKGHLVETDRSGLVAEYVGQTAVKTNKIIDSALDGVLFIDEAYSLVDGGQSDYGKEAISTLLKRMEDDRNRLVVILAGYTNDMKRFIDSNPGLQSRFNRYIEFPDYTADELLQIFEFNLKNNEYRISDEARSALTGSLQTCVDEKDERFGNGRFVRNLFEKTIERQANRLSQAPNLTAEMLTTIEVEDLPE